MSTKHTLLKPHSFAHNSGKALLVSVTTDVRVHPALRWSGFVLVIFMFSPDGGFHHTESI
ncbi:hypothetical protein FACS1894141_1140 [Spirochaetia bacterium]|nr:hypothetical protein FACS1894141_1140 [Spirochaetia bacterium]